MAKKASLLKGRKIKQQSRWLPFMLPYAITLIGLVLVLLVSNIVCLVKIGNLSRKVQTLKISSYVQGKIRALPISEPITKAEVWRMIQGALANSSNDTAHLMNLVRALEEDVARLQAKLDITRTVKEAPKGKRVTPTRIIRKRKVEDEEPVSRGTPLSF